MEIIIVKNSAEELIITQRRRLTVTGSMFCVPAFLLLFNFQGLPILLAISGGTLLWMIILHSFFKGIIYTIKANKTSKTLDINIRSILGTRKTQLEYSQIHHVIMAETHRFLPQSENCRYHLIIEGSNETRLKFMGFKNRNYCKQTAALIESYL